MSRRTKKRDDSWYDINLEIDKSVDKELKPLVIGEYIKHSLNKLGKFEDIEEWLSKLTFYGTALNDNKILELKFEKFDFRPKENLLFIHFKILNNWATNIMYDIFSYGKRWALTREELKNGY